MAKESLGGKIIALPGPPRLSYEQALRAWFVWQGRAYSVENCDQDVFVAFIESLTPAWAARQRQEHLALHPQPLDRLLGRWFTLDTLVTSKVVMQLYSSEQEATCARERSA